jgi:hypothetical protein
MKPGDIVKLRSPVVAEPRLALVVDISDDYVKVLMDGLLVWMPTSFVVWSLEGSWIPCDGQARR